MGKIKIEWVDPRLHLQKGFEEDGCVKCLECNDNCCTKGADVDRSAYDAIFKSRGGVEALIGMRLEDCFNKGWGKDAGYPGGNATRSKTKGGACVFKLRGEKGCALFKLAFSNGLTPDIVPAICRTYPITWNHGKLFLEDEWLIKECHCFAKNNCSRKSIFETQKSVLDELFDLPGQTKAASE
jgi:hypothetical protein